jgi:hypothetical protein
VVCNPRRNALLKEGSKTDKIDARKLAELLRGGLLRPVYHGENGLRTLRELARSDSTLSQDMTRVMNRIKAWYRSWEIPCGGVCVYDPRYRGPGLEKISEADVRRRAEIFYEQLDGLRPLRQKARRELLRESRKHKASKRLLQIPSIGPLRAALLVALVQTPHRFRSKRQLWADSGLAVKTHDSAQYRYVGGQRQRSKKPQQIRGLNKNHNHQMKEIFKSTATRAIQLCGAVPGFLCEIVGQRHGAGDGSAHAGSQNRGHYFDNLEERQDIPFYRITLSQVPRREAFGFTRLLGAGALVDRVLTCFTSYWTVFPALPAQIFIPPPQPS